mmetsp:Transcript_3446/g.10604  ORF Transcript_3446/g.10604 Transcript_3446/m.10604 type:complete len:220 (+) Transcript_3446:1627-2286(+)
MSTCVGGRADGPRVGERGGSRRLGTGRAPAPRATVVGPAGGQRAPSCLVGIKHEQDEVNPRGEPADDILERVEPVFGLLLPREDPRRVDERAPARKLRGHLAPAELGEEGVAELAREREEGGVRVGCERIARKLPRLLAIHDGVPLVGRRLRADVHAREVALEEVSDEGGLTGGVLADEHHHRLGVEVCWVEQRVVEGLDEEGCLERPHLSKVEALCAL